MSSKEKSQSKSSAPAFRFRGLTVLLICTLTVNVVLVTAAWFMRPDEAHADPKERAGKSVAPQTQQDGKAARVANQSTPTANPVDLVEPTVVRPVDDGAESSDGADQNPTLVADVSPQESDSSEVTGSEVTGSEVVSGSELSGSEMVSGSESSGSESSGSEVATAEPTNPVVAGQENDLDHQSIEVVEQPEIPLEQPELAVNATPRPQTLLLINPAGSGGEIYYLVDGKVHSLAPGQEHDLGELPQRRIEFHRGESYGEASLLLDAGTYYFQIGHEGWALTQATAAVE